MLFRIKSISPSTMCEKENELSLSWNLSWKKSFLTLWRNEKNLSYQDGSASTTIFHPILAEWKESYLLWWNTVKNLSFAAVELVFSQTWWMSEKDLSYIMAELLNPLVPWWLKEKNIFYQNGWIKRIFPTLMTESKRIFPTMMTEQKESSLPWWLTKKNLCYHDDWAKRTFPTMMT